MRLYVNTTYEIFLFYIQRHFLCVFKWSAITCIIIFFSTAAASLAVGLSVFFFILFCVVIPIAIVLIYCCVFGRLQHTLGGRTVVRTTVTTTVNTPARVPAAAAVTTAAMVCFFLHTLVFSYPVPLHSETCECVLYLEVFFLFGRI